MSDGPLPTLFAPLTIPASWAYASAVARRNAAFDRGEGVERLDVPVVSVGNVTVGGTGKSPMVAWIVARLRESGRHPLIAMRGYKAGPGQAGDEEREYRLTVPGTPIVAQPDRKAGIDAFRAARRGEFDCVVLDDGFQHRQIARDCDIVLVDAQRPGLDGRLLPAGWLREPATSLARASAVVITRALAVDDALARRIAAFHGHWPIAWARHGWKGLSIEEGDGGRGEPVAWLAGRRVYGVFGTGHPQSVQRAYEAAGASVVASAAVGDHAAHDAASIARFTAAARAARCDAIATTRKDWTKLADHAEAVRAAGLPFVVPDLSIEFLAGEAALRERLSRPFN